MMEDTEQELASAMATTTLNTENMRGENDITAMARVMNLPEILTIILQQLRCYHVRTLAKCLRVSELWEIVARRCLYESLGICKNTDLSTNIREKSYWITHDCTFQNHHLPLAFHLFKMNTTPERRKLYSQCVRYLDMEETHSDGSTIVDLQRVIETRDLDFSVIREATIGGSWMQWWILPKILSIHLCKLRLDAGVLKYLTSEQTMYFATQLGEKCPHLKVLHIDKILNEQESEMDVLNHLPFPIDGYSGFGASILAKAVNNLSKLEILHIDTVEGVEFGTGTKKLFRAVARHSNLHTFSNVPIRLEWSEALQNSNVRLHDNAPPFRNIKKCGFAHSAFWQEPEAVLDPDLMANHIDAVQLCVAMMPKVNELEIAASAIIATPTFDGLQKIRCLHITAGDESEVERTKFAILEAVLNLPHLRSLSMKPWARSNKNGDSIHLGWWHVKKFVEEHPGLHELYMGSRWHSLHGYCYLNGSTPIPQAQMKWTRENNAWEILEWSFRGCNMIIGLPGQLVPHHYLGLCFFKHHSRKRRGCRERQPRDTDGTPVVLTDHRPKVTVLTRGDDDSLYIEHTGFVHRCMIEANYH